MLQINFKGYRLVPLIVLSFIISLLGYYYVCLSCSQSDRSLLIQAAPYILNDESKYGNRLNLLEVKPPRYLPQFVNPCWWESADKDGNPYINNTLLASRSQYFIVNKLREAMQQVYLWWEAKGRDTWRLRCLPQFYVIGMTKCGTSDLWWKLIEHPELLSPCKEYHWWTRFRFGYRLNFRVPMKDYIDLFDEAADIIWKNYLDGYTRLIGDGSPNNMGDSINWWTLKENLNLTEPKYTTADYIHHFTPRAKIIISLRNPTDRLYSHYLHVNRVNVSADLPGRFHLDIVMAIEDFKKCLKFMSTRACVYRQQPDDVLYQLTRGLYYVFITDWLKVFARDQIHIHRLEDYTNNQIKVLMNVHQFLNISAAPTQKPIADTSRRWNSDKHLYLRAGLMWTKTRFLLDSFYKPFNNKLVQILTDTGYKWQ